MTNEFVLQMITVCQNTNCFYSKVHSTAVSHHRHLYFLNRGPQPLCESHFIYVENFSRRDARGRFVT